MPKFNSIVPQSSYERDSALAKTAAEDYPYRDSTIIPTPADVYVWWKVSQDTDFRIRSFCESIGLPCDADLHLSIVYSQDSALPSSLYGLQHMGRPKIIPVETARSVEFFGQEGECLVVEFSRFPSAEIRQAELVSYGLTTSFPTYRPHITINSDVNSVSRSAINALKRAPLMFPIIFDVEEIKQAK